MSEPSEGSVIKNGWMTKQGGFIKSWRRRWFILKDGLLSYYKEPGMKLQGVIHVHNAVSVSTAPECPKPHAFKIDVPSQRVFYIYCETQEEADDWIKVLDNSRKGVPVHDPNHISLKDFQVLKIIGRGTYGKVSLVRHLKDGKIYAMKSMSKRLLQEYDQIGQIITERDVLLKSSHPFLVGAQYSFQNEEKIYLVIDYVPGGELFSRLREEGRFTEERAKLYAAEIALGLGHLHSQGFVYRDLKPENILVDRDGHLKITDFGLAKGKLGPSGTTQTFCGTPEYIAPEILQQLPYTKAVDWWSFGILMFEMLTGFPPFYDENMTKMYRSIMNDPISYPHYISANARDFMSRLLDRNPLTRLGSSDRDIEEIKEHPFFEGLNWDDVINRRVKPQWLPELQSEEDTKNFAETFTTESLAESVVSGPGLTKETQREFVGFTMTQDSKL